VRWAGAPRAGRAGDRVRSRALKLVRIANDYTITWPLWNEAGPMERDEIDVPEPLRARLLAWAREFNDRFDWENGWDSPDLSEPHAREGRALRDELAAHLGPGYDVRLSVWESGVPD